MAKKKKTKFKKELKKTLHGARKSKSNKLIYAVGGGLAVVLIVFVLVMTGGDKKPVDKEKFILDTVKYLQKASGVTELKVVKEENKLVIVYNEQNLIDSNKDRNFKLIARDAAILLSNKLDDEEIKVLLTETNQKAKDYLITSKNGTILSAQDLEPNLETPVAQPVELPLELPGEQPTKQTGTDAQPVEPTKE